MRLLLRSHQPVSEKLEAFGFRQTEDGWYWACPIHAGDYEMQIVILADGRPDYTLIDQKTKEAYALVKVASAQGAYVEALRKECGDVLLTVIDRCYDRQPQIRRILKWIEETYAINGEYLWNDHPDDVVFRHPENRRWFAMILSCFQTEAVQRTGGRGGDPQSQAVAGSVAGMSAASGICTGLSYEQEILVHTVAG